MRISGHLWLGLGIVLVCCTFPLVADAGYVALRRHRQDPYGWPRPGPAQEHVPPATSFYIELAVDKDSEGDLVERETVGLALLREDAPPLQLVTNGQFTAACTGRFGTRKNRRGPQSLTLYVDPRVPLEPSTTYTVSIRARSRDGLELRRRDRTWKFTTSAPAARHTVAFDLDLTNKITRWHGGFFTGICRPSFCTSSGHMIPSYEIMAETRARSPKAVSLLRNVSLTGMDYKPAFPAWNYPNVVRELETRRIVDIAEVESNVVLRVEDFFGHGQYGIESDRPLSSDYHAGDEVLIADGAHDARTMVVVVSDTNRTVTVQSFESPAEGWGIAYTGTLPTDENPNAPGLFPPGGCYLRKFQPSGTPRYYWARLDKEHDLTVRSFGFRLVANFTDAPADLSIDGRSWTYPKDYAEYHEVARAIASHLIERYGDDCLDFVWSVFNEADLAGAFWRGADWTELQKFYDYTVDAVCRAFEDHGYDSERAFVGGVEMGGIFGFHIGHPALKLILIHCSPNATGEGALDKNPVFADKRLDGKRSRRVETLCRANDGRGSPCDFISVHTYNRSEIAAEKLIRSKALALETDAGYYTDLWVNSHESCPSWSPPPDPAAADSYLGNGYFPSWCADFARRLLSKAAEDARYGFGETILTVWPWPITDFGGLNNLTRAIRVDDDGDGKKDRTVTLPVPVLHFLGLLANMGDRFWVLPERVVEGHVVSGIASQTGGELRILVYSHDQLDTQSRSENEFDVELGIAGLDWPEVSVASYRFDKDHNSYFRLGRRLRDRHLGEDVGPVTGKISGALDEIAEDDPASQMAGLKTLSALGTQASHTVKDIIASLHASTNEQVRAQAMDTIRAITQRKAYSAEDVAKVQDLAQLKVTNSGTHQVSTNGVLRLTIPLSANGVNFLTLSTEAH